MSTRNEYSRVACMHSTATRATRVVARARLRRVLKSIYLSNVLIHETLDMEYEWQINIRNEIGRTSKINLLLANTRTKATHYTGKWMRSIDTFEFYKLDSSGDLICVLKINSANSTDDVRGLCEINYHLPHRFSPYKF